MSGGGDSGDERARLVDACAPPDPGGRRRNALTDRSLPVSTMLKKLSRTRTSEKLSGGAGSRTRVRRCCSVASTCVVGVLLSPEIAPANRLAFRSAHPVSHLPRNEHSRSASPLMTFGPGPQAVFRANGSLSGFRRRERTRYRSRLLVSHGIYEVARTLGTQPVAQFTSVETMSPPCWGMFRQSMPLDGQGQAVRRRTRARGAQGWAMGAVGGAAAGGAAGVVGGAMGAVGGEVGVGLVPSGTRCLAIWLPVIQRASR